MGLEKEKRKMTGGVYFIAVIRYCTLGVIVVSYVLSM
jgi:hypothetical protein